MAFNAMENGAVTGGRPPPRKQRAHEDEEQGKLFVGGLSWDTTQETLLRFFGRFGEVIDCVVMKNAESGRSRGFGFVTFSDPANIEAVLSSCPHTLDGRTIDPKACNPRSMQKPKKANFFPKVFLGGLPSNITETDLRNFFSRYGEVCEIIIMYGQEKKKSRGFGFLSFSDDQAVNRACAEHFVNIQNKQVEIKRAEPRAQAASAWNKEAVDQWGGSPLAVSGGPPPITLGSPMQQQQASHSNGGPSAHHYSSWGSQPAASTPQAPAGPYPTPTATQYGSTPQIVPWGHHPPSAPTPPTPQNSGQWGSFASPPPAAQFPTVYHPPPHSSAAAVVSPSHHHHNYWNNPPQPTPPPQAAYYAPPAPAPAAAYPPPLHNKAPPPSDFYHAHPHPSQNTINMGQPPLAISPPGAYSSDHHHHLTGLGPQRGAMYSTQPSQYHPYRRS